MPKVSVIIPSYNHEAFIRAAVDSVLNQTMTDFELIIIDDGSQDDSLEILSAYTDNRIQLLFQSNQGAHAAINRGIHRATGQYITILNSDDIYSQNRLAVLTKYMDAHLEVGLVGTHIEIISDAGEHIGIKQGYQDFAPWPLERPEKSFRAGTDLVEALLGENYFATTSNFFFRAEKGRLAGDFRPLRYVHDWDFVLRLAKQAPLALLPEPLVQYRMHDNNTIRENREAMVFEIIWLLAVHLPQHISPIWLTAPAPHLKIDQLLHSLYTFKMDRILMVMLLQEISQFPDRAMALLETDSQVRNTYLEFIHENIPSEQGSKNTTLKHRLLIDKTLAFLGLKNEG